MTDSQHPESAEAGPRRSIFNPIGRIVDSVVPSVTNAVDVDGIVRRIDVDDIVRRIDVDELIDRVDVNTLVARIDVDQLLAHADIDALVARIDIDALISRIDLDALIQRVDVNALVERIDIDGLLSRTDVDALVARVDADAVIERVDVNGLLDRIDVDRLANRIDIDLLVARIDVDAIVDRVDVDHIVQRADLAGIVAQSTRGITASTLDLVRRQVAGLDEIITRVAARLMRRDPATDPHGPPALLETQPTQGTNDRPSITGHYAGPGARTVAFAIDWWTMVFLFGIFTAMASWVIDVLAAGDGVDIQISRLWSALAFGAWAFVYFAIPMALTGKTFGKAVVGLRVVDHTGAPLRLGQAFIRVLVLPLSFALLGLGLVGALFGRRRRTLHDAAARSVEVIDWGDRPAALPTPLTNWLEQRHAHVEASSPSAGSAP